ncbi:hypothetical protein CW734_07680 [Planococcus sp. MB-3u-03]|nr:hypothetical protein CW734_07680 [Planococcus sp. MB-3u-03]
MLYLVDDDHFHFYLYMKQAKNDAVPHLLLSELKKLFSTLKLGDGVKRGDAWGTERAGETKVARYLPPWLNTRPIPGQLKTRRPVASAA